MSYKLNKQNWVRKLESDWQLQESQMMADMKQK